MDGWMWRFMTSKVITCSPFGILLQLLLRCFRVLPLAVSCHICAGVSLNLVKPAHGHWSTSTKKELFLDKQRYLCQLFRAWPDRKLTSEIKEGILLCHTIWLGWHFKLWRVLKKEMFLRSIGSGLKLKTLQNKQGAIVGQQNISAAGSVSLHISHISFRISKFPFQAEKVWHCDPAYLFVIVCTCLWLCVLVCDSVYLFMTLCTCLWPCVPVWNPVYLFGTRCTCLGPCVLVWGVDGAISCRATSGTSRSAQKVFIGAQHLPSAPIWLIYSGKRAGEETKRGP